MAPPTGPRKERGALRRPLVATAAVMALALGAGIAPAVAACPEKNPSYTGACGPTFVLPGWGDAGGWTDPEQYETIQLADVDGDGADELLGRTPTGLAIHDFDTTLGHWRPQVDAEDRPIVLTAFADPPPLSSANPPGSGDWWNAGGYPPKTDWTLPQYYDTIQAADIDKDPGEEVLARSRDGVIVFKFTSTGPGKGFWRQLTTTGPLKDSSGWGDHPAYYTTMGTGDFDGDGDAELFARGSAGPTVLDWNGSSWRTVANITAILSDDDQGRNPAYYTSLQAADIDGDGRDELMMRDFVGVTGFRFGDGFEAQPIGIGDDARRFSDRPLRIPQQDCPFAVGGGACLGSAPAYYGTLQSADITGDGIERMFARTASGLRGYDPRGSGFFMQVELLADRDGYLDQSRWETVQFADVDGDGRDDLLARGENGIDLWRYSPGWHKEAPTTPLALADDPWGSDRSYYATIQAGDVDGDGRDDVVARGPYGIRTWFWDRRGTQGWESYLSYGYPDFPTPGQQAAFAKLNALARDHGHLTAAQTTIRDVWTAVTEPTADLKALMRDLATIAGCPKSDDALPQYASCQLPAGADGLTAADWTAVVNRIVAELYHAGQVMDHFHSPVNGVRVVWKELLLDQLAELPAITQQLKLESAADIRAEFDANELFSGAFGIAGAIVGLVPGPGHAMAAVLEVTSEVTSMIPSASESLNEEFDSTLGELETKFARGVSEANLAMAEHSEIIRRDAGLLTLVGQLRARGTWTLDPTAMESSGQQGFSEWLYKSLLPAMYVRYVVTNCYTRTIGDNCEQPNTSPAQLGLPNVAKGTDSSAFSLIGPPPNAVGAAFHHPCERYLLIMCHYEAVPAELAELVWGEVSDECIYDGTTNSTAWRFGACNVGVDPLKSVRRTPIENQNWGFTTYSAAFWVCSFCITGAIPDSARSAGADRGALGLSGTVTVPGPAVAARGTTLRLSGTLTVPRAFRLGKARVTVLRLLHERGGGGELTDGRTRLSPGAARRGGARVFVGRGRGGSRVRLELRRRTARSLAFSLRASRLRVELPHACGGIRRGVDLADEPILLHTRLRIDDGEARPQTVAIVRPWHCWTDRRAAVRRLVVQPQETLTPSRGGLTVRVNGPRRPTAGGSAIYRIAVRNRRRTPAHDVRVRVRLPAGFSAPAQRRARPAGNLVTRRIARLDPGETRVLRVRTRIAPSVAGARRVVMAGARAIDTRSVAHRLATRVRPSAGARATLAGARVR